MSTQKTVATVKEFAIVKAIMSVLKLDDAGKISKFFEQEIKENKNANKKLEMKIKTLELTREIEIGEFEGKIEDATDEVEIAYQAVKPEDVASNSSMKEFSSHYWANIKSAERNLTRIQEDAKLAKDRFEELVKTYSDQIDKRKARIAKISKKA